MHALIGQSLAAANGMMANYMAPLKDEIIMLVSFIDLGFFKGWRSIVITQMEVHFVLSEYKVDMSDIQSSHNWILLRYPISAYFFKSYPNNVKAFVRLRLQHCSVKVCRMM